MVKVANISICMDKVYGSLILICLTFSVDRASFPPTLAAFVSRTESISTSGNPSKGECMDANLEEVNKESKVWQHGMMNALDWLRIFRNLGKLTKVSTKVLCSWK